MHTREFITQNYNGNIVMHTLLEKEHQQLIDLLDALDESISKGGSASQAYKHLDDFVALTEAHFRNEEVIMKTYSYPEISVHKKEHADLLEELYVLKDKLGHGHTPFGQDYMQLLREWLDVHLFGPDSRLDKFLDQAAEDRK